MSLSQVLLMNLAIVACLMLGVWLLSLPLRNASIVDIFWGAGFVLLAWATFAATESTGPSRWLLPLMTTLWGGRLSGYLAWRNLGRGEDKRYAVMRSKHGPSFAVVSLFTVFALQGAVMWTVSLPVQIGIACAQPGWIAVHVVGVVVWAVGLLFESIGDTQLARFKAKPENEHRVLKRGLWRYTRHPNYFGDFLVWWGLFFVAVAHGAGLWTVIGPIVMSVLLMRISGVTLLEKSLKQSRPEYEQYVRQTNTFFPWFPANTSDDDWTVGKPTDDRSGRQNVSSNR